MKPLRKTIRFIAAFLIVNMLYYTFYPSIAFALTAGPTAPEATSFEPVDTTDMVNLQTGDFTYNIPLLEVPGPSGGYPVNLAYHAGIQTNQEASWVGLGWSLNPGAINRLVNGYPDEVNDQQYSNRQFWQGGAYSSTSVGISVGFANLATVSADLTFANDTYKGTGVGVGVGLGIGGQVGNANLGVNVSQGVSPFGGSYSSAGVGVGIGKTSTKGFRVAGNIGLNFAGGSTSFNGGASVSYINGNRQSSLGASLSSSGLSVNTSKGGVSGSVNNSKAGKISSTSNSWNVDIPLGTTGINLRLGRSHVRYWSDESESINVNGAIYFPTDEKTSAEMDTNAYDVYDMGDTHEMAGTLPDYDKYNVVAQGVSGSIRPYHLSKNLYRQNIKNENGDYDLLYYPLRGMDEPVEFRFENDFSNKHIIRSDQWQGTNGFGWMDNSSDDGFDFNATEDGGRLSGSKHIEWYTNEQISGEDVTEKNPFVQGFINTDAKGFERIENVYGTNASSQLKKQIGGFKITNETGVTYHFALPAYSYDETTFSESIDTSAEAGGYRFNHDETTGQYAYTWLLTAVTGPDFVDRSTEGTPNGLLDDEDWGYWVKFDYGLWTDSFHWRNPGTGFNEDVDNNFRNFSKGKKEIYYLNSIETSTHKALFVKQIRADGKSANPKIERAILTQGTSVTNKDEGNFETFSKTKTYYYGCDYGPGETDPEVACGFGSFDYNIYPKSSLRLNSIYLFKKGTLDLSIEGNSNNYDHIDDYTYEPEIDGDPDELLSVRTHYGKNVLDIHDLPIDVPAIPGVSERNPFYAGILKKVDLGYDYSLCQNTENSFYSGKDTISPDPLGTRRGKLSLKSLNFLGKAGADLVPPTNFSYQKNPDYDSDAYDLWGFYKNDYVDTGNKNLDRRVTAQSSLDLDVWSLSTITSSLGSKININYEPDSYKISYNNCSSPIKVHTFEDHGSDQVKVNVQGVDLTNFYSGSESILIRAVNYRLATNAASGIKDFNHSYHQSGEHVVTVSTVNSDHLILTSAYLHDQLFKDEITGSYRIQHSPFGGNFSIDDLSEDLLGGGLRVNSIEVVEPFQSTINKTKYSYDNPETTRTSGVTPSEPLIVDVNGNYDHLGLIPHELTKGTELLQSRLRRNANFLMKYGRMMPGPGVTYEFVKVTESVGNSTNQHEAPAYSQYHFEVFDPSQFVVTGDNLLAEENTTSIGGNLPELGMASTADKTYIYDAKKVIGERIISDYTNRIGSVKKITLYNHKHQILNETVYGYLKDRDAVLTHNACCGENTFESHLEAAYNNMGLIEESYHDARFVSHNGSRNWYLQGLNTTVKKYPSILISESNTNYSTGISTTTHNLEFDFYSGDPIRVLSKDGYGNSFLTITTPAYKKYNGMGLMADGGKNMLQQTAATYTYAVEEPDLTPSNAMSQYPIIPTREALLSANIQTWNDHWQYREPDGTWDNMDASSDPHPVWRKHKSYSYNAGGDNGALSGDGLFAYNSIPDFNEDGHPAFYSWDEEDSRDDELWQKNSEITLYDRYSHALEATDINGNYAATKMDINHEQVYASVANASYNEFAYCGAEDTPDANGYLGGEVLVVPSYRKEYLEEGDPSVHTGNCSIQTESSQNAFQYTLEAIAGRKYLVSTWSNKNDIVIDYNFSGGSSGICSVAQGNAKFKQVGDDGWYQITALIEAPSSTSLRIQVKGNSGTTHHDDFRVHPVDAPMTSYVYNQWGELSYVLDNNNLYTHYKYDAMGRLISTHRETIQYGEVKLSEHEVRYAKNPQH